MDLHGIDLNLLVAFDALMAERSVTKAGVRIGRTQPAMSAALSRLRALLKDELFIRGPNGLQPTARALDLSEPLGRALADHEMTISFSRKSKPVLRIGSQAKPSLSRIVTRSKEIQVLSVRELRALDGELLRKKD